MDRLQALLWASGRLAMERPPSIDSALKTGGST